MSGKIVSTSTGGTEPLHVKCAGTVRSHFYAGEIPFTPGILKEIVREFA